MSAIYKQSDLSAAVWDSVLLKNAGTQLDTQNAMNFTVREVLRDIDLRSAKRLAPVIDMFSNVYDYSCPADIKGTKIIDLVPQVNRSSTFEVNLVSALEFDVRKGFDQHLVAFNDHDMLRKFRASIVTNSVSVTLAGLDSLSSGGGTWVSLGDTTSVSVDNQNYVQGVGSLLFQIGSGATGNAGIQNTGMSSFDITNFLLSGSVFAYVYIQNITGITNFQIKIGSSSSNYYSMTATQTNEGNSFSLGWNLLRFDLSGATKTGSPVSTANTFMSLAVNSSPAITASANWRFDGITINNGQLNQVLYYSKFGWQDASTQAYKENSAASGDYLVADTEEFNLIALRCRMESDYRLQDWDSYEVDRDMYAQARQQYLLMYPSDALLMTQTYYDTNANLGLNTDTNAIVQEASEEEQPLT